MLCRTTRSTGGSSIRRLGPRLALIQAWCEPFSSIADIGAHEGLLAQQLALAGHRVTATEITPASWAVLRDRLHETAIDVVQGDGLRPLAGRRFDAIVIAGMGYDTILEIMGSRQVLTGSPAFIIQPMQGALWMHQAIRRAGWTILKADIARQRQRLYPTWLLDVRKPAPVREASFIPREFAESPWYRPWLEAELHYRQTLLAERHDIAVGAEAALIEKELERI